MFKKKTGDNIIRIVEIDRQIKGLRQEIMALERERRRLDNANLDDLYEQEQTI